MFNCKSITATLLFVLLGSTAFAGPIAKDLPGVPLSRVQDPLEAISNQAPVEEDDEEQQSTKSKTESVLRSLREKKKEEPTSVSLAMNSGENLVIPVAIKHPNRILTPFTVAKVFTTRTEEIKTDGSIIYATPSKDGPLTMFITDRDGDQSVSLSLTLVPSAMPPREIKLVFNSGGATGAGGGTYLTGNKKEARKFERRNSHYEQINSVMLALAKQEIPTGYNLRNPGPQDPAIICDIPGVVVRTGQMLEGYSLKASVSVLSNPTDVPIQIKESACWQEGVLGVATWPSVEFLQPGEAVELYVLLEAVEEQKTTTKVRPALLSQATVEGDK